MVAMCGPAHALNCAGYPVTVDMTAGDVPDPDATARQVVRGTMGNDTIVTGAGDDVVCARFGDDDISTGKGNDIIRAGFGNDSLTGGPGHDQLFAGPGADTIYTDGDDSRVNTGKPNSGDAVIYIDTRASLVVSGQSNACAKTTLPSGTSPIDWLLSNDTLISDNNMPASTVSGFYGPELPIAQHCDYLNNYGDKYIGKYCRGGAPVSHFLANVDLILHEIDSIQSIAGRTDNYFLWVHGESGAISYDASVQYESATIDLFSEIIGHYPDIIIVDVLLSDLGTNRPFWWRVNQSKSAVATLLSENVITISSDAFNRQDAVHYSASGLVTMAAGFCGAISAASQ